MVIVRFAPSASGDLHLGSARTALYNWLFARQNKGKFILRIEDTNEYETKPYSVAAIKNALQWLGLDWDEFYLQSERDMQGVYLPYIERLKSLDLVYPCFCSEIDLIEERSEMLDRRTMPMYDGTCRRLSLSERKRNLDENKSYILRFATPYDGNTYFEDFLIRKKQRAIKGKVQKQKKQFVFANKNISDFVIARPNAQGRQVPTFLFANTIDDHEMGVTHVIRGEEHIHNTPRQILLQQALGFFKPPVYVHVPTVLGYGGLKLSSSSGDTGILEYKRQGYLPEALLNMMLLLGYVPRNRSEIITLDEMLEQFNLEDVSTRRGMLDLGQLQSLNSKHIRRLSDEELAQRIRDYVKINESRFDEIKDIDYVKVASICKDRLRTLADLDFLFQSNLVYQEEARELLKKSLLLYPHPLKVASSYLTKLQSFSANEIENTIWQSANKIGISRENIAGLIRAAITGTKVSPNLFGAMSLLGKKVVLKRINNALQKDF